MDSLKCAECGWEGDYSDAHEHEEVSAPSTLLCPRCFCESLEEAENEDLVDEEDGE